MGHHAEVGFEAFALAAFERVHEICDGLFAKLVGLIGRHISRSPVPPWGEGRCQAAPSLSDLVGRSSLLIEATRTSVIDFFISVAFLPPDSCAYSLDWIA